MKNKCKFWIILWGRIWNKSFFKHFALVSVCTIIIAAVYGQKLIDSHVLEPYLERYQNLDRSEFPASENIEIIKFAKGASHNDIFNVVNKLMKYNPAVVGIDIIYKNENELSKDSLLFNLAKRNKNIVLTYDLLNYECLSSFIKDSPNYYSLGYANLDERNEYCTDFHNYSKYNGKMVPSFAAKIASLYLARDVSNNSNLASNHLINYEHNEAYMLYKTGSKNPDLRIFYKNLTGKIVLLIEDNENDYKKTPIDYNYMPTLGGVVHYHIIQTILEDESTQHNKFLIWCKYIIIILLSIAIIYITYIILTISDLSPLKDIILIVIYIISYYIISNVDKIEYVYVNTIALVCLSIIITSVYGLIMYILWRTCKFFKWKKMIKLFEHGTIYM